MVNGEKGESVGETPTGATGTVALPGKPPMMEVKMRRGARLLEKFGTKNCNATAMDANVLAGSARCADRTPRRGVPTTLE